MNTELEEILQHHGVKGMHWGRHKSSTTSGQHLTPEEGGKKLLSIQKQMDSNKDPAKHKELQKEYGKIEDSIKYPHKDSHTKKVIASIKREHSWNKTLKNSDNMSTKDIQKASARAQLENDFKRLSKKHNVGSAKEKADYLNRANMSDQELFRKVTRLRAKDNLNRTSSDATKKQLAVAKKVVSIAAPLVISYAMGKALNRKDVVGTMLNPNGASAKLKQEMLNNILDSKTADAAIGALTKLVKHSDIDEDVLLHSVDNVLDAIQHDDFDNDDLFDILQHHGVKGMHWGVHKRIGHAVTNHIRKRNELMKQRLDKYHGKMYKKHKLYTKLYDHRMKRNGGKHYRAVRYTAQTLHQRRVRNAKFTSEAMKSILG